MILTATALALALPQQPERFPAIPAQDARRYELDLQVDVAAGTLRGTVDYTFTALEQLSSIRLDARRSDDWQVTFTTPAGAPLDAAWADDHCVVTLPEPAAAGTDVRFRAALAGTPVDGFYFKANRYGAQMAFTDHYSIRARGWLPCEDHPADRAVFTTTLR